MNAVSQYISEVQKILQSGDAREHAYRPAFQRLMESMVDDIQSKWGQPPFFGLPTPLSTCSILYFLTILDTQIAAPYGILFSYDCSRDSSSDTVKATTPPCFGDITPPSFTSFCSVCAYGTGYPNSL